ncbi:oxygenase MpaB family protein [Leucobacter sp. W1153]|uniref:oxygenase MpaB family protein n=1 Tax=Leucobacter sp. W1153 TaxID=3439064 RepID=UPI003F2CCA02
MPRLTRRIRARVLETFSGDVDGTPPWVRQIERGSDIGFFGPGSATWAVHGGMPTLVAGVRALLMQALHPGAMAGVHDWSRYKEDPLGRLAGTIQWLLTVTFGDEALARRESQRVAGYHRRVRGTYQDSSGVQQPYSADDPELKLWVHAVFTDAFLGCHLIWGDPIPGGADQYVSEWSVAGELLQVPTPPTTAQQLSDTLDSFAATGVLIADERVRETLRFLKRPPLHRSIRPAYRLIYAAAVASLEPQYRDMLGLKRSPFPVIWLTGVLLRLMRVVLGPASSSEAAARKRIAHLESTP